ncbi:hypothetical protein KP509_15G028200 [Ceratopteris richardii]|uniref:BTB domain-containing protein n=1 Tax=Ceratopteris richardii TaxID=49495 RepID=A0A8T2T3Q5_CERRI|nr:hypothetical protein KP509_15G028200 [Ceratopteris richardii]
MEVEPAVLHALSNDYLNLLGSTELPMLSDVTFCIDGRRLHAHRCILAARSHFFRILFSQQHGDGVQTLQPPPASSPSSSCSTSSCPTGITSRGGPLVIPVDVVGLDAFVTTLRFLYSGQLILPQINRSPSPSSCPSPSCQHLSCSYAIDFLLELVYSAHFFGISELTELLQAKLLKLIKEGVPVESLLRVLATAAGKQKMQQVWCQCLEIIARVGVAPDALRRCLPPETIEELMADGRFPSFAYIDRWNEIQSNTGIVVPSVAKTAAADEICSLNAFPAVEEQKILRLQQALDCMDVELVKLMVIGEGLDLDRAFALHYSVANCSREVVKALLELGVVDVNFSDSHGRTALHLAAAMGNAEMVAVLLDHHADPRVVTRDGLSPTDILRSLMKCGTTGRIAAATNAIDKADQKRLHLCIELLQSAAAVARREEAAETSASCVTQTTTSEHGGRLIRSHLNPRYSQLEVSSTQQSSIGVALTASVDAIQSAASQTVFSHGKRSLHALALPQYQEVGSSVSPSPTNLHHFAAPESVQFSSLPGIMCDIYGDSNLVVSPVALDPNLYHNFLGSSVACIHRQIQSPAQNADRRHQSHQEGKPCNTGSSSDE